MTYYIVTKNQPSDSWKIIQNFSDRTEAFNKLNELVKELQDFEYGNTEYEIVSADNNKDAIQKALRNQFELNQFQTKDFSMNENINKHLFNQWKKVIKKEEIKIEQTQNEVESELLSEQDNMRQGRSDWKVLIESKKTPIKAPLDRKDNAHMPKPTQTIASKKDKEKRDRNSWKKELDEAADITEKPEPRQGLEGPFHGKNNKWYFYDPKEGKYYDHTTDLYLDDKEIQQYLPEECKKKLTEAPIIPKIQSLEKQKLNLQKQIADIDMQIAKEKQLAAAKAEKLQISGQLAEVKSKINDIKNGKGIIKEEPKLQKTVDPESGTTQIGENKK